MALRFPSIEFLEALEKREQEKPSSLTGQTGGELLVGVTIDASNFMVEFEDGVCVAAALGGNPNDVDFILEAPGDSWRAFFHRIGEVGGDAALAAMVGPDGKVRVHSMHGDGIERFEAQRSSLASYFEGVRDIEFD